MRTRRALSTLLVVLFSAAGARALASPITVDARALSAAQFNVDFVVVGATSQIATFDLAPGVHTFCAPPSQGCFTFSVTSAGTLEFDRAFDGFVSGRGTSTLTVMGFAIHFDGRQLSAGQFNLNFDVSLVGSTTSITTFQLLPGDYTYCAPPSQTCFPFKVTLAGTVDYDASLDGFLAGRGTDTLVPRGFQVGIDATALAAGQFNLNFNSSLVRDTATPVTLPLLPGDYTFCAPPSVGCFVFNVTSQGTVDYSPAVDAFVSGRGTSWLRVFGFGITIDARALGPGNYTLNFPEGGGTNEAPQTFNLTPGAYTFFTTSFQFTFMVTGNGTVDYEPFLDAALMGRGTDTLVVLGDPGNPPTLLNRIRMLRSATDALNTRVERPLLVILDQAKRAVEGGKTQAAVGLMNAYIRVVAAAIQNGQIDPAVGHVLSLRADAIMRELAGSTR